MLGADIHPDLCIVASLNSCNAQHLNCLAGEHGLQGPPGPSGEKGEPGVDGIPGSTGERGDPGMCSGRNSIALMKGC